MGGLAAGCSGDAGDTGRGAAALSDSDAGAALQAAPDAIGIAKTLAGDSVLGKTFGKSPTVSLRSHGGMFLPDKVEEGLARAIGFRISERATGPSEFYPVDQMSNVLELTAQGASDVKAELSDDGRAVYKGILGNSDLIVSTQADRVQHTIVIRDSKAPDLFVWNWKLAEGMSSRPVDGDRVALFDNEGKPQLTIEPATIVDAAGKRRSSVITFDPDGYARLPVSHAGLAYPIAVDYSFVGNAVQTLAAPPTVIKGRVMVLVDTSGSMILNFSGSGYTGGDSDATAVFCDNQLGTGFGYTCGANVACTTANGGRPVWQSSGSDSRLFATKKALQNVINANSGVIDFGLERYIEDDNTTIMSCSAGSQCRSGNCDTSGGTQGCTCTQASHCENGWTCDNGYCRATCNGPYCCPTPIGDTDRGRCQERQGYTRIGLNDSNDNDITYITGCGTATGGGRVLESTDPGSYARILPWIDYVEDFCSSTGAVGGRPRNPELRGRGPTPLVRSVVTARESWYRPYYTASKDGNLGDDGVLDDPLIDCRPYVLVAMTDGSDTCTYDQCGDDGDCNGGSCVADNCTCTSDAQCSGGFTCRQGFCATATASTEVQGLYDINTANRVRTYVLGMGNTQGLNTQVLDQMAVAGGTTEARLANSQAEIEAAFADIVAQTVKYEVCNAADDNCNAFYDEGLGVYQECATMTGGANGASPTCHATQTCNGGRCTCTTNAHCAAGYICGAQITGETARFCKPACTVGQGACQQTGVKKCGAAANQCCVNNNSPTCTTLNPLPGMAETCNMLDDNCNGLIDENIPGGCPVCIPQDEACDGDDDNCNGINDDGLDGQPCGSDVGLCQSGTSQCPPGGGTITCIGSMGPFTEVCNGHDDNCDGVNDGMSRPCYTGPAGTENVGICHGGTQICNSAANSGVESWGACNGQRLPATEVCNNLNDDCDCAPGSNPCQELIDEGIPAPGGGGAVTGDPCCPSGTTLNNGECCAPGETCMQPDSACRAGTYQCSGSVVVCAGGVGPTNETCNMIDDNCNGEVDDLPGKGTPCIIPNTNSCAGVWECDFVNGGLQCVSTGNMTGELCNNLDDDCDNQIDEIPDVLSDPNLMGECDVPDCGAEPCTAPCMPGHWVCKGGERQCEGAVHPRTEFCNGVDDDCDGMTDAPNPCPGATQCQMGECREPCRSGEFPCPGGQICQNGFCVDDTGSGGSSASGGSGGQGTGGSGVIVTGGASNTGGSMGDAGETGAGGDPGSGGSDSAGGSDTSGGTTGTAGTTPVVKQEVDTSIYGLATGGGGCGCKVAGASEREKLAGLLLAAGLSMVLARRRRARQTVAFAQGGGAK